jgi:basic membrane lipoprotein Med (substrate-binding protein (PBP1-ABC) superfamily)
MTFSLPISLPRPFPGSQRAAAGHARRAGGGTPWAALLVAVLSAALAAAVLGATAQDEAPRRVLVVVDGSTDRGGALAERARAAVARAELGRGVEAQLRVTRTPTEQLNVTHFFAAKGYDAVVGVGLERGVSVAPVARAFPDVRFVAAAERELDTAVARAAR